MDKGRRSRKLDLPLLALLLLGAGYLTLVLLLGTFTPFVLTRGATMEPAVHVGDLLVAKAVSPAEVHVGDLILFQVPPEARRGLKLPPTIAHRILAIEGRGGELVFATKGDNSDADPFKVPATAVRGVVVKNLGPVGRPILFLTNSKVLLFLGLPTLAFLAVVLATLWLMPNDKDSDKGRAGQGVSERQTSPGTQPAEITQSLNLLASAVAEYGVHLQSHTAVVKHLASSSGGLKRVVGKQSKTADGMRLAVQQQNQVLADLAAVVKELKNGANGSARNRHTAKGPDPVGRTSRRTARATERRRITLRSTTLGDGVKGRLQYRPCTFAIKPHRHNGPTTPRFLLCPGDGAARPLGWAAARSSPGRRAGAARRNGCSSHAARRRPRS
jgi:signal peptidase